MSAQANGRKGLGPWKGRVFLSVGRALYLGPAGDTTPHAHHAVQVGIALDTPFRLRHAGQTWNEFEGVVVAANATHQLDGHWGDLVLFYVEPESIDGRRLLEMQSGAIHSLSPSTIAAVRAAVSQIANQPPTPASMSALFAELMQSIGLSRDASKPTDERVERAVRQLRSAPRAQLTMSDLARSVGLSASRFRAVFRREIGMSAQSYVVWLRINAACDALAQGASLSEAAYQAGFSDAAHFARTFRRTFGLAPSQLAGGLTLVGSYANDELSGEQATRPVR